MRKVFLALMMVLVMTVSVWAGTVPCIEPGCGQIEKTVYPTTNYVLHKDNAGRVVKVDISSLSTITDFGDESVTGTFEWAKDQIDDGTWYTISTFTGSPCLITTSTAHTFVAGDEAIIRQAVSTAASGTHWTYNNRRVFVSDPNNGGNNFKIGSEGKITGITAGAADIATVVVSADMANAGDTVLVVGADVSAGTDTLNGNTYVIDAEDPAGTYTLTGSVITGETYTANVGLLVNLTGSNINCSGTYTASSGRVAKKTEQGGGTIYIHPGAYPMQSRFYNLTVDNLTIKGDGGKSTLIYAANGFSNTNDEMFMLQKVDNQTVTGLYFRGDAASRYSSAQTSMGVICLHNQYGEYGSVFNNTFEECGNIGAIDYSGAKYGAISNNQFNWNVFGIDLSGTGTDTQNLNIGNMVINNNINNSLNSCIEDSGSVNTIISGNKAIGCGTGTGSALGIRGMSTLSGLTGSFKTITGNTLAVDQTTGLYGIYIQGTAGDNANYTIANNYLFPRAGSATRYCMGIEGTPSEFNISNNICYGTTNAPIDISSSTTLTNFVVRDNIWNMTGDLDVYDKATPPTRTNVLVEGNVGEAVGETITGLATVLLPHDNTAINGTAAACTTGGNECTLPDGGADKQRKSISMSNAGNAGVVTITNCDPLVDTTAGGCACTFNATTDYIELEWSAALGKWLVKYQSAAGICAD